ncbi:MAG: Stp1/IreP family PP2C-type Ser/Thr phosphatase [Ruminococcaceae bacterium]|nr:Stp1/IreP family PP2C-type Ser/Thr phosphatase [Oscillospiraceae bacterium]
MLQWEGCTDLGKTRPINEDGYYISAYSHEMDAAYAMVADGMGGHQAGEVASTMAVRQISDIINESVSGGMDATAIKELLGAAVKKANSTIYEKSRGDISYQGMGTTLTLCFCTGEKAMVVHVGDSRAYLFRDGVLHQITTDHSLVQALLQSGQITEVEAAHHPQKNVITRALGTDFDVEIDIYEFSVFPGDVLLLSTDGLTNLLSDEELTTNLANCSEMNLEKKAQELVAAANERGGYDNITAVLGFKK